MFFEVQRTVLIDALEKRVEDLKKEMEDQTGEERFRIESELAYHEALVKQMRDRSEATYPIRLVRPGADWSRWPESYALVCALMRHAWKEFGEYSAACEAHFKDVPST